MYKSRGTFNDSRFEFEQKLNMLAEKILKRSITFSYQTRKTIDSIAKVRKLPNGRIDLNTVDEMVRVTANSISHFDLNQKDYKNEEE